MYLLICAQGSMGRIRQEMMRLVPVGREAAGGQKQGGTNVRGTAEVEFLDARLLVLESWLYTSKEGSDINHNEKGPKAE